MQLPLKQAVTMLARRRSKLELWFALKHFCCCDHFGVVDDDYPKILTSLTPFQFGSPRAWRYLKGDPCWVTDTIWYYASLNKTIGE